jgi:outer membrane receptor protein involved in Fe transport
VHLALVAAAAAPMTDTAFAQDQQESTASNEIGTVVVTGSRIRRVDLETASPVYTLDRSSIDASGVQTMGDLLQQVPSVAGAATNPQVNNGGGDGASNIELRGLSPARTLVLVNGRRIGALGYNTSAVDINSIPVNMVERVEVLKEGAGAIYGSDAIAGVVNFITRKDYDGADVSVEFGQTDRSDGQHESVSVSWGASSEKASVMLGLNWNKQDEISAGDRDFSKNALYLYNAAVVEGGSSRVPTGRVFLDPNNEGCGSVTRIEGTSGASLSDYRCFDTATDLYNYQPLNKILTPQERGSIFAQANYKIGDFAEAYAEILYNRTTAGWEIAELPFDSRADNVVISAQSIYNPFGVDLGGAETPAGLNPNATWRMVPLGTRHAGYTSDGTQVNMGLRGAFGDSSWTWDVTGGYGRIDQTNNTTGYLFQPALANAFGPSFIDPGTGEPTCGTPAAPISGCVPVNIFNLFDSDLGALQSISADYNQTYKYSTKMAMANFTGDLAAMPAGALSLAVGAEYREQEGRFDTDFNTQATEQSLFLNCLLAQETCSGDSRGDFDVKEVYAEMFIPLVADKPGVKALNVTVGARYSDYSTFGNTTNFVGKLEYRPVSDLLIRGSWAEIFRAPTIYDLFHSPTSDAPTFTDPCEGIVAADVAANPNLAIACQNVPLDGTFAEPNGQITGSILSDPNLDAETGEVYTFGFVYDASWLPGFSVTVDFWNYKIDDPITPVDVNFTAEQCVATADPTSCNRIHRNSDGTILVITEPTANLGSLETSGVDVGFKYRLRTDTAGDFQFSLDGTYIDKYDSDPGTGAPIIHVEGTYDRQYGNIAQWRALGAIGWAFKGFDALATVRYIDSIVLHDPDGFIDNAPDLQIGSKTYLDLVLGYTLPTNTTFRLGVDNLTDEQPPLLYQNNVINANTDVSTYDTIGRAYWASIVQKF